MIGKIRPNAGSLIEGGQQRLDEARWAPPLGAGWIAFEPVDSARRIRQPKICWVD